MSATVLRVAFTVLFPSALAGCGGGGQGAAPEASEATAAAGLQITHVPEVVYTSVQGAHIDPGNPPANALANNQHLTWLFHVVLHSPAEALHIQNVAVDFSRGGQLLWQQNYPRSYLENLTWLQGAMQYDTNYFLDNIEFVDNQMTSAERSTGPDIPAAGVVTWARFQEARPYFGRVDAITFRFQFRNDKNEQRFADHTVPVQEWQQKVKLRLPFDGVWIAKNGNDLATGHRRTGLNGLTTYGWDFMKIGEDGRAFRTDGSTPADYYTYDAPVLAPADGVVTHVRNDIEEYGIGVTPPRERLEADGDVFAGNLVIIDHGNGEFTLTSHMRAGTIPVQIGDSVTAGQLIGRAGNSGTSMMPHIHINLMDRAEWLEARGIPSLFSDFERIQVTAGAPQHIARGNPVTGWHVRPVATE